MHALRAAEVGVLVLSTMHISSTDKVLERLLSFAPEDSESHLRTLLAETLNAVVHQELVPTVDGNKRAACETLVATTAVRQVLRQHQAFHLRNILSTGKQHGMQTMKQSLDQLRQEQVIDDGVYNLVLEYYEGQR